MQIAVSEASIAYGDQVVFENLSAIIASHRVTAIVGPSGSGKSSLLAAMAGFQVLQSGSISIKHSATGEPLGPSPSNVAWVSQGSNALGARSVLDNVTIAVLCEGLTLETAEDEALHVLAQVGLEDKRHQIARTLSGGELQRLAIARALASHRSAVFADEPSANLDEINTRLVADIFSSLSEQATIVVATHDPMLVAAADDVVFVRSPK